MLFSVQIRVPMNDDGWTGFMRLPTIQIEAPTKPDAIGRMYTIIQCMPKGTAFDLVAI
jgi:hypothetical protein